MIYVLLVLAISLCCYIIAKGLGIVHNLKLALKKRKIVKYLKKYGLASMSGIAKALHERNVDILPLLIDLQRDGLITSEKVSTDEGCPIRVYWVV